MNDPVRRFGDLLVEMGLVTEGQVQQALALQPLTGTRVGEALLSLGFLTRAQLQRALSFALQRGEAVVLDRPPLGEILVGLHYVNEREVADGLVAQQKSGKRIGEVLVDQGVINHQQLYEAVGLQRRMAPFKSSDSEHSAPGALGPGNGIRVVVIDDSDIASTMVREGLASQGYDVTCFHDPFIALEQVDLLKPDLVLTDLDMPGLDGCEVCHRLKHSPSRSVPVIILTGNDGESRRVQGLREGADDYVHKGVSMEELSARIENVLRHSHETEKMRRLFARYTSDAVVDQILKTGDVVLSGERRDVTVLFADIRSFTKFAEMRTPEEVMRLLNEVLGRLADAVLEWGGTLDKFLGDGLMAVWGAPVHHEDDAAAAVSAALAMNAALTLFHQEHPENPRLELGIGLNSGPVVAGSLGSTRRTEYTCIGDTVNVGSRLCSLAGPGEIFVGEGTAKALASIGPLEPLAAVKVKGRSVAVPIYRLTAQFREALAARNRF